MSIMAPTLPSLVDRLLTPLGDYRQIFVQGEQHSALEALWASDDRTYSDTKWIGGKPAFLRFSNVLASSLDRRFDTLTSIGSGPTTELTVVD